MHVIVQKYIKISKLPGFGELLRDIIVKKMWKEKQEINSRQNRIKIKACVHIISKLLIKMIWGQIKLSIPNKLCVEEKTRNGSGYLIKIFGIIDFFILILHN